MNALPICPHDRRVDPLEAVIAATQEAEVWRRRHASLAKFSVISALLNAVLLSALLTALSR